MVGVGALMLSYAATKSVCAVFARVSAMCCTPDVVTVVLPVNDEPGKSPISPPAEPLIVVGPVFVMVVPPRTAKDVVLPAVIVGPAADTDAGIAKIATRGSAIDAEKILTLFTVIMLIRFCYFSQFDIEARCHTIFRTDLSGISLIYISGLCGL